VIAVERLTKEFQRRRVLDELALAVDPGERVALVGANGAGKTTLIRCLLGQYTCAGRVAVAGLDPRASRGEVLRRVGFVPQLPPPLRMPVGRLLRFAAEVCGGATAPMEAVSARLGLEARGVWRQPFGRLSGGQKQKLLIAVALGRPCELLLMDEPAANLDPQARRAFFELLAERQGRATMLISSHRIDEVAQLVSRVIELDHGKVVLDDRVDGAAALDALLACEVELASASAPAEAALRSWGLASQGGGRFVGTIAGPDRLRFLGTLARYAGLLRRLSLDERRSGERGE
jgi:ABC-2 type transport system ATP-binding protein